MKDITIHEVGMENYGPYIDPMILTFKNDTVTLLVGPNGVGKMECRPVNGYCPHTISLGTWGCTATRSLA